MTIYCRGTGLPVAECSCLRCAQKVARRPLITRDDLAVVFELRTEGVSWKVIARHLGFEAGSLQERYREALRA
jgi:hypothetical protein